MNPDYAKARKLANIRVRLEWRRLCNNSNLTDGARVRLLNEFAAEERKRLATEFPVVSHLSRRSA